MICFGRTVVAVGRAHAVPLPEDYSEQRLEFIDRVSPDMTSWMHHDLERGHRLEVPWLSGGVVKIGREAGVETPLNRAVADILSVHANGHSHHCFGRAGGRQARPVRSGGGRRVGGDAPTAASTDGNGGAAVS